MFHRVDLAKISSVIVRRNIISEAARLYSEIRSTLINGELHAKIVVAQRTKTSDEIPISLPRFGCHVTASLYRCCTLEGRVSKEPAEFKGSCHHGGCLYCHSGGRLFVCNGIIPKYHVQHSEDALELHRLVSLYHLCLLSGRIIVYTYNISTLLPTGFVSPVFEDAGYFDVVTSLDGAYPLQYLFSLFINVDDAGQRQYSRSYGYGSSLQVLIRNDANITLTFSPPLILTIYLYVTATIKPGNNSSPLPTYYTYSSDTPFLSHRRDDELASAQYEYICFANPNEVIPFDPQPYDYVTNLPATNQVDIIKGYETYTTNGQQWPYYPVVCSTVDAIHLYHQAVYGRDAYVDQRLQPFSCGEIAPYSIISGAYTLIPPSTVADVTVSSTNNYTLNCRSFGDASHNWALVKYDGSSIYGPGVQADFMLQGQYIASYRSDSTSNFHDAIWCGQSKTVSLSVTIGPFETVAVNRTSPILGQNRLTGFTQIDLSSGLAILADSDTPWNLLSIDCESPARSIRTYLKGVKARFAVCQPVQPGQTMSVGPSSVAFTFSQPDAGYCVVGRGYPASTQFFSNTSYTFIDGNSGQPFTVTCGEDVVYAVQASNATYNVTFTLMQAVAASYGQTYDVNGLVLLQYPPSTTFSSLTTGNSTGSASVLPLVPYLTLRRPPASVEEKYPWKYDKPIIIPGVFTGPGHSADRYIFAVRGAGTFTNTLTTEYGQNVGYTTYTRETSTKTQLPTVPPTAIGTHGTAATQGGSSTGGAVATAVETGRNVSEAEKMSGKLALLAVAVALLSMI
ncbi:hypothetical protein PROFUN_07452 [Planoprotostelium fungivorum]|uniref:Uncharacterized protein n=1 Tax=Planoprotostelium fungivorum TaxID=1890364 RepID=A0A2P6NLL3_9EUKA|nr:hypothetical protein PROFUN_07452 [Planoprotostelium fungivorum]